MMKFACRDLGLDCDYVATGESTEEVVEQAKQHGHTVHADVLRRYGRKELDDFLMQLENAVQPA